MSDFGSLLKGYEHVFVFLTLVGVLVLIYFLLLKPAGYVLAVSVQQPQGFQNYSAGNLGFYGDRTDSSGDVSQPNPYASTAAQSIQGFSNSAYEPPVYWPAGSLGLINAYDQEAIKHEGDQLGTDYDYGSARYNPAMSTVTPMGFRNRAGNYALGTLQGFRNRRKSGMQNALDNSLLGY